MRLIHLSDIHFCGYGPGWDLDTDQRDQLVFDVQRLVEAGGTVDAVLVGGDIAFMADPEEYTRAIEWLIRVAEAGGCSTAQVWVVPGNHDLHRKTHNQSPARRAMLADVRERPLHKVDEALNEWLVVDSCGPGQFAGLKAYNDFAEKWGGCGTSPAEPNWTDRTLDLDGLTVFLTGLNTVIASDTNDDPTKDGPKLVVGAHQCKLEQGPTGLDRVHIAFGHHPPSWIRDWEEIEGYLRRAHILLFGHLHNYGAIQRVAGGTVEVQAGAVGPERTGDPNQKFAPSWNLITLTRSGGEIEVKIEPRVWFKKRACFEELPDGPDTFRVKVDLRSIGNLDAPAEAGEPHGGANPSPLIPSSTEVLAGVDLPDPSERARRREIGVSFLRFPPTRQLEIAEELGVADDLTDAELGPREIGRKILQRVRENNLIDELVERMNDG